ncbi:hypothetical protein YC2023_000022 [Brassica napus]
MKRCLTGIKLSLTRLPRHSCSDAGRAGARRRRLRPIFFFMVSFAPSQNSRSVTYFAFPQSFILDLEITKLEKTFVVSARVLETTGPASFTGESWNCGTKTTSPCLDPQKGWLSICNRSATHYACTNGASHHLFPLSEFNFQLRSRSERTSTGFSGSELLSDKAQSSDVKNTSSHRSSSTSRYKRDSVPLLGGCSIPKLPIFTVSYPPSCATVLHPANEVCPNSAARTLLVKFRSVEGNADISPSFSSIWARPMPFAKGVSPFSISQNINFNEKTKDKDLVLFNSFSMSLDGFTEPLIQTIVNTMLYHSIQKRSLLLWLSMDSPVPSSKTFSMRSVISPAIKQMKLSKSLTVLLSCGAVRTGPEDATDFVSTIFRGTVSAYTIASRAFEEASSWQKTMILKTNTEIVDVVVRTEENIGWIKPPSGCLKCNVGSSWVDPHHPSGASWILRGEDGQTIMHSRRSYSFMRSKAEADLWAMLWAVECMHNTHQVNVIFEASSEQLHNVLCEPLHHLEFTGVVQSINQLLNGINGWSLDHALQERNEAAAAIAVSVTRDRRYQSYMAQHEPAWLHQLLSLEASSN